MTTPATRYLEKFTSLDELVSQTFPGDNYEYQPEQDYRRAEAVVAGADYAWKYGAAAPFAKAVGVENVRFTIWGTSAADADSQFDTLVGTLRNIGMGKLWLVDSEDERRWAYAVLLGRPSKTVTVNDFFNIDSAAQFARYSDWFSEDAVTGSQALTESPTTFVVNNPGNAPAELIVWRLRANGPTGFTNPTLANLTNGYQWSSTRDAESADSELKVDGERMEVGYSNSNGSSYDDDYAAFSMVDAQVAFMRLEPGNNTLRYTDGATPDAVLEWEFPAPWH